MATGILLINLGTPDAPEVTAVRRYLRQFLTDQRVIDLPAVLRYLLVYCFILPFRPAKSSAAYRAIWEEQGSPLLKNSKTLKNKLQKELGAEFKVTLGMRYGQPELGTAIKSLSDCERIVILPLFPQYSSAATGSAVAMSMQLLSKNINIPQITVLNYFYQKTAFIDALTARMRAYVENHDFILFSYHGLPVRQVEKSGCASVCHDNCPTTVFPRYCYRAQCFHTTELLAQKLGLKIECYATAFQSRLGKTPWIEPYMDSMLADLSKKGVKSLAICCPSFVADCLETLEEIGIRARQRWFELGGERFTLIPCLNDDDLWVKGLAELINSQN